MLVELQTGTKKVGFQMALKYNWNFHSALRNSTSGRQEHDKDMEGMPKTCGVNKGI